MEACRLAVFTYGGNVCALRFMAPYFHPVPEQGAGEYREAVADVFRAGFGDALFCKDGGACFFLRRML